jgi:hypothetical protein
MQGKLWKEHPNFDGSKGKVTKMTIVDHHREIEDGIFLVDVVNSKVTLTANPFWLWETHMRLRYKEFLGESHMCIL